ncbi:MAG: apolipoprotein N-acyltransferase [Parcubacteria group bacterium Gr01-1014_2]|nr:MAG: apolipoprotein N-acyltransferase [Parcubacteria group bacterium Gr01-1014_2]
MDRINQIYKKIIDSRPYGFWAGFIIGLFYFSWIFWWLWSVYPLVSLGTESKILASFVILIPFIVTVAGMSLFWGIFSYSLFNFFKKAKPILLPFFYAGTFVLVEYLRTWFFGILWAGPDTLLGPHWTLGNPAYLFADLGLIRQSASYWGIYGIDFLIVFFPAALFLLVKNRGNKSKMVSALEIICIATILILTNLISSQNKSGFEKEKLTISVIQTKNPIKILYEPEELLADFSEKNKLLKEVSKKSDIVIFPESADFSKTLSGFLDFNSAQKYFNNLSQENVLIIDNNRILEQDGLKSKVILIDSKNGILGFYDKKLLTPGGETIPYLAKIPILVFEYILKNNFISSRATFSKGTRNNVLDYKNNKIKIIVCSDIISPSLSRSGEFGFMVNLNNLAVFNGNKLIEKQLLSMAKFRAAENKKYLVVSSNFGHSYIINPAGNIADSTDSSGYQILTGELMPNRVRTWYNKLGNIPILSFSFLIVLLGLKTSRNRKF